MVPEARLELAHTLSAADFESAASTNSATRACVLLPCGATGNIIEIENLMMCQFELYKFFLQFLQHKIDQFAVLLWTNRKAYT